MTSCLADGSVDLEAVRESGFEGSLNLEGYTVSVDPETGAPRVRSSAAAGTADTY